MTRPLVRSLEDAELERIAIDLGAKPFQARALRTWVWQRGLRAFADATDLPKSLRADLAAALRLTAAEVRERTAAADGTTKLLLELHDGESIEMVLIPDRERTTLCVSSQVGCPVACVFCASGLSGVRRNLEAAEIVEQFVVALAELGERRLTNVVVMGLGEPMLNLETLLEALDRIADPDGFRFSPRRITVSTSGYPDRIRRFASHGRPYGLAVSLHAADASLRQQLVPTATHTPRELVAAAREYLHRTGREPTFEIVLLAGLNDRARHADGLVRLLHGLPCTVNLIPWNRVDGVGLDLASPSEATVLDFRARLEQGGLAVTWRRRRGHDRDAACGQLRLRHDGTAAQR